MPSLTLSWREGVRKYMKDFDWLSNTATQHAVRGTTPQHRTQGCVDEGIAPKIELTDVSTAISSSILHAHEDDQCWLKHVVCIHQ
jgi:hypothetical protein